MTAAILQFTPRRQPGPRIQSERSKVEPLTAHQAIFHFYFAAAMQDARLTWRQCRLLMELSALAADSAGRPLGYSIAELSSMFSWEPAEVRADAEACAKLGYLDLIGDTLLLRDPRDRRSRPYADSEKDPAYSAEAQG